MAELIYLELSAQPTTPQFPPGITLERHSPEIDADFKAAIQQSYQQTLDCPALNGVRSIDDVVAGHRAAGEYNPANWLLLRDQGRPAGVLVLAQVPGTQVMELVYIGLAADIRGRGIDPGTVARSAHSAAPAGGRLRHDRLGERHRGGATSRGMGGLLGRPVEHREGGRSIAVALPTKASPIRNS